MKTVKEESVTAKEEQSDKLTLIDKALLKNVAGGQGYEWMDICSRVEDWCQCTDLCKGRIGAPDDWSF